MASISFIEQPLDSIAEETVPLSARRNRQIQPIGIEVEEKENSRPRALACARYLGDRTIKVLSQLDAQYQKLHKSQQEIQQMNTLLLHLRQKLQGGAQYTIQDSSKICASIAGIHRTAYHILKDMWPHEIDLIQSDKEQTLAGVLVMAEKNNKVLHETLKECESHYQGVRQQLIRLKTKIVETKKTLAELEENNENPAKQAALKIILKETKEQFDMLAAGYYL